MKKIVLAAFVLCLVAMLSAGAFAQPGGGGRGPGGPGGPSGPGGGPGGPGGAPGGGFGIEGILRNEELRKEINLTEEQATKLRTIAEENQANFRRQMPRRQEGERPTREEMEKMRAEMEKQREAMEAKIKQVLTAEQQEKVATLRFQLSGGLESRDLNLRSLEALGLSAEQIAKVKAIEEERRAEFRAIMEKRGPIDWRGMTPEEREKLGEEMRAQGEAMRKKYSEKVSAVLTAEQKEKAEKLTAEGKDLREKLGIGRGGPGREGRRDRRGGDGYQPGADSWQPGQGGGPGRQRDRQRRSFPQTEE